MKATKFLSAFLLNALPVHLKKNTRVYSLVYILMVIFICFSGCKTISEDLSVRKTEKIDFDWRFHKADAEEAHIPEFDDSGWRMVDLPHDWSIEDLDPAFLPDSGEWEGPFYSHAPGGRSTGYTLGGTAWYRKHFRAPKAYDGKQIYILFDGVYMNSDVWINGQHVGNHPYGYTSFWYDITDQIKPGNNNVIAVQVKNEGQNSRWYSGSGIYRHVWLISVEPVHVVPWGIAVSTPSFNEMEAIVNVSSQIVNKNEEAAEATVTQYVLNAENAEVSSGSKSITLEPGQEGYADFNISVPDPILWSVDQPYLYTLDTEVIIEGKTADRISTPFGIRTIEFSVEQGCLLNGMPILLKGGCMHHDNGPLGARAYDRAEERRVEIMKANGYNAIRTAHNPPSPAFLDACDRIGMLVIDEAFDHWQVQKNPKDYHNYFYDWWEKDLQSMVYRDRNHPSVILWSTGNEIMGKHLEETVEWSARLADRLRELDPTRAVTNAIQVWSQENWDTLSGFMAPLDVVGYNYHPEKYEPDHEKHPVRIIYCSESNSSRAFEFWMPVLDLPWVFGDFVWTSYDYLGEASIGWHTFYKSDLYPWTLAFCGDIDILGYKRPQSFYRDVLWETGNKVSVFVYSPELSFEEAGGVRWWGWDDVYPSWTWEGYEGQTMKVDVYSSCDEVELFLNDKSQGKKITGRDTEFRASWYVVYEPGVLQATGYTGNEVAGENILTTAGNPSGIRLTADRNEIRADRQDLSYILAEVMDENGILHPFARNLITFEIQGPGEIIAAANSDPMSTESYQQSMRNSYEGRCQVIVKSDDRSGTIILKARSEGLQSAEITINTNK